jgi:uncharacterized membrane protein
VVAALALIGFVGYKTFLVNAQNNETAAANAQVQELQQQVVAMQKRIDTLGKHRKGAATSPAPLPGFTAAMNLKSMTRKSYRPRVPWLLLNQRSALLVSPIARDRFALIVPMSAHHATDFGSTMDTPWMAVSQGVRCRPILLTPT